MPTFHRLVGGSALSPDRPRVRVLAPDHRHPLPPGWAGTACSSMSSCGPAGRARRAPRARHLRQLRVQPVPSHRLPPPGRQGVPLLPWLHRLRAAPQRLDDRAPEAPARPARGSPRPARPALHRDRRSPSCWRSSLAGSTRVELHTDEHPDYPRALRRLPHAPGRAPHHLLAGRTHASQPAVPDQPARPADPPQRLPTTSARRSRSPSAARAPPSDCGSCWCGATTSSRSRSGSATPPRPCAWACAIDPGGCRSCWPRDCSPAAAATATLGPLLLEEDRDPQDPARCRAP